MEKAKETMSGDTALAIVIPVMDDWRSAGLLLDKLDAVLVSPNLEVEVFVVDDGSTLSFDQADFSPTGLANIDSVSVIELKRNMGHQRAITIGLSFVAAERKEFDAVVVMDGDGEDNPSDVVKLLDRCREEEFSKMIFARRSKRSEGVLFRFFYYLFVRFFRLFTIEGECETLVTMPGIYSLNFWTGIQPPTTSNTTAWLTLLNNKRQKEIIDKLSVSSKPCIVYEPQLTKNTLRDRDFKEIPLAEYILKNYTETKRIRNYQILTNSK